MPDETNEQRLRAALLAILDAIARVVRDPRDRNRGRWRPLVTLTARSQKPSRSARCSSS